MSSEEEAAEPSGAEARTSARIAGIERSFLRLTFWQTLLSLAGVFTGAVALYAALNESQAVRQQTAASVWPYVQYTINDFDDGEAAGFGLNVGNVGVGPARMRGLRVSLDGTVVTDWQTITDALLDDAARLGVDYGKTDVGRRVIAPGDNVAVFHTERTDLARALQTAVYGGRIQLSYCYCSIFDQCWLVDTTRESDAAPLSLDGACPDFGAGAFLD
jgi:hypothetical protein